MGCNEASDFRRYFLPVPAHETRMFCRNHCVISWVPSSSFKRVIDPSQNHSPKTLALFTFIARIPGRFPFGLRRAGELLFVAPSGNSYMVWPSFGVSTHARPARFAGTNRISCVGASLRAPAWRNSSLNDSENERPPDTKPPSSPEPRIQLPATTTRLGCGTSFAHAQPAVLVVQSVGIGGILYV